ncbi:MAG TPA: hypothetical protein DCL54_13185 [Alphaproteobacteria bacterium]|nr:hypothetical protein [Alphaproteobacteria bacterium]
MESPEPCSAEELDRIIAEMQMYLRAANNGELPKAVDELIAMRRAEAARELEEITSPPEPA